MKTWTKGEVVILKNQHGYALGTVKGFDDKGLAILVFIKDGRQEILKAHPSRLLSEDQVPENIIETLLRSA